MRGRSSVVACHSSSSQRPLRSQTEAPTWLAFHGTEARARWLHVVTHRVLVLDENPHFSRKSLLREISSFPLTGPGWVMSRTNPTGSQGLRDWAERDVLGSVKVLPDKTGTCWRGFGNVSPSPGRAGGPPHTCPGPGWNTDAQRTPFLLPDCLSWDTRRPSPGLDSAGSQVSGFGPELLHQQLRWVSTLQMAGHESSWLS